MAIISASRRTDIPTYFSDWLLNRLENGSVMVRNPYNPSQVSEIPLNKNLIDCIVLWTKNPIPMIPKLNRLNAIGIPYYFQYTLTAYGRDMEENLPDKYTLTKAFKELCEKGNGHVIWRYDPIMFNEKYTPEFHLGEFERLASSLCGYTEKCVISFVDSYSHNKNEINEAGVDRITKKDLTDFCKKLSYIADSFGMKIGTCAEVVDLEECGIEHNKCVDPKYIEEIIGVPIKAKKDGTQRESCGCIESIDIGSYNTCLNGCKYCYACKNRNVLMKNFSRYDPDSPLLCDSLSGNESISKRRISSLKDYKKQEKESQLSFF